LQLKGASGMSPNPNFLAAVKAALPDSEAEVCVGCKAGPRSAVAVQFMRQAGYQHLSDVAGGFDAWCGCGLPVV
jgi:rhodanese-related sulfurtransferase